MSLANISSDGGADDQDDERDDTAAVRSIKPVAKTATMLLLESVLTAAMTPRIRNTLTSSAGRAVIVEVPSASYAPPMVMVLHALNPAAQLHVVTEKKRKGWSDDGDLARYFAAGRTVLAITQDPTLLPPSVHAAADLVLSIGAPTAAMVRKVINIVTGGRARPLADADLAGRDLDEIAAAIRPGSSAAECVLRLKHVGNTATPEPVKVPELATLPLFGEAGLWVAETLADLERLRRGEIAPQDLENVLLYGPPGTGKTLLARALAHAAGLPFFDTSVAAWFTGSDGHLDGVLKAADAYFQTLLDNAPSVGLLDEIEALPDRQALDSRHREWWNGVITGVLLMVTRVRESGKAVILIGATNYADRVDGALKRPGRLGRHVYVRQAETEAEVGLLFKFYVGDELDEAGIALAATLASGATPAQVAGWVKAARRTAREAKRPLVLDDLVSQIAPADSRTEAERFNVALHEAGHAVAALVLRCELKRVSIIAEGNSGGVTSWRSRNLVQGLRDTEDQVVLLLSGRAADELLGNGADTGARFDLEMATAMLVAAEASCGLRGSLVFRSDETGFAHLLRSDPELLGRIDLTMQELMGRASALVLLYREAIVAIATTLVRRRILSGPETEVILAEVMAAEQVRIPADQADSPAVPGGSQVEPITGGGDVCESDEAGVPSGMHSGPRG